MSFSAFRSSRFFSPRLLLALLVLALLTACATPITARVTRFNQWPADIAGSTFSFLTPVEPGRELEQATYESHVQAQLEQRGFKSAPAGQVGRLQVEVAAESRGEQKTYLTPVYQDYHIFLPPYRDAAGRIVPGMWVPDPFGPRYVGERPVRLNVQISNLRLRILDTKGSAPGQPRPIFESRAVYEGEAIDLSVLVPYLVRAVFDELPGQNGQVRTVQFDRKTGALIRP
ncbi:MAG: hypothetical protein A3E79_08460 [Burkholderiales bacterium RIFCSPHIGHO2_12_FULL_61_11]|nr:MAG: hypothetical protein A3E79_08460 [Burkholderiales bacterium RIFCSPHIGHO2_12_FULL_61_11]